MEFDPTKHIPIADHKAALQAQQADFDARVTVAADHQVELDKLRETLAAEHAEALAKAVAAKDAEIACLTAPDSDLLAALGAAFKSSVPAGYHGMFGVHFAVVRILLQADETELARATVEAIQVPEELAEAKAQILSLLP